MVGHAVCDAMGTAVEFLAPGSYEPVTGMRGGGMFSLLPGQWTDDTSMSLATAVGCLRSGLEPGSESVFVDAYAAWAKDAHWSSNGRVFDVGRCVNQALREYGAVDDKSGWLEERMEGKVVLERAAGNGGLMKLLPAVLALLVPVQGGEMGVVEAIERMVRMSRVTHPSPIADDATRVYAAMLFGVGMGEGVGDVLPDEGGVPYTPPGMERAYWECLGKEVREMLEARRYADLDGEGVEGAGYVVKTLEAVMWALHVSAQEGGDFGVGALAGINLGKDADTVGAIYGAVAGMAAGSVEALPQEWVDRVVFRPYISQLAEWCVMHGEGGWGEEEQLDEYEAALTTLEAGYKKIYDTFSPGPGPPMVWPRGYKSVSSMQEDVDLVLGSVECGGVVASFVEGYRVQLEHDLELLGRAIDAGPARGSLLAALRK